MTDLKRNELEEKGSMGWKRGRSTLRRGKERGCTWNAKGKREKCEMQKLKWRRIVGQSGVEQI